MSISKIVKPLVCLLLLFSLLPAAYADGSDGNMVIRDDEIDYPPDMKTCAAYTARVLCWTPSEIKPEAFGLSVEMTEYADAYGGHAYIWNDGARELFVSDYGYAGYNTPDSAALTDILQWYGGLSELQLDAFDLSFAARAEAEQTASQFLAQLGILNAVCTDIYCLDAQSANSLMDEMSKDGYERCGAAPHDAYILRYVLKIDALCCDAETFTLANQQDVEGCALTLTVDQNGVQSLDCAGPIYAAESVFRPEQTEILSFDEIRALAANKFNNLILSEPVEICDVQLQYVLLPVDDGSLAYIPCWCFATPRGTSGRYVWYRFNAYTGAEII